MIRVLETSVRVPFLVAAVACFSVPFPRAAAAQAVIKVSDDINFKFGFLLQPQADWTQDAASGEYQKNLFIRRVRLIVGGQLAPRITFFFETDDPNLGKSVAGTKTISTGFIVQDAYVEWKARDEFALDAGLMFIPLCRNCYTSGALLLPIDYGAAAFLAGGPTRSVVGRDTGFMARGYLFKNRLEYRLGAFQGFRDALSNNAFRSAGHLQYTFFDTEAGFFTAGTYLGKKKVLTVGGGFDAQSNYKAFAGDLFFDRPVGPGALTLEGDFIHYDGGHTFTDLPKQNNWLAQAGFLFTKAKVMPWVKVEGQKFSAAANEPKNTNRFQVGLSYFNRGQNVNIKAGYGRIDPKVGPSVNQFTVQLQFFYL